MLVPVPYSRSAKVQALPVPQGAVLRCMRAWVAGRQRRTDVHTLIGDAMQRLGAEEAAPYFEGFMGALWQGAIRPVAIGRIGRPVVGVDERLLLGVLTCAQEGHPSEALSLLRNVVTTAAAGVVLRVAEGLVTEMALAGCFLAPTDFAVPDVTSCGQVTATPPGSRAP